MRHRRRTCKFDRFQGNRQALIKSLVKSLFAHQKIRTSIQKAKEARRLAEELITLGKKGSLSAQRKANSVLNNRKLTSRLFKEIAPLFKETSGGYTRIIGISNRKGDNAKMAILELTKKSLKAPSEPKPPKDMAKEVKPSHLPEEKAKPPKQERIEPTKERAKPIKKPPKRFLGGLRGFFRKERDAL